MRPATSRGYASQIYRHNCDPAISPRYAHHKVPSWLRPPCKKSQLCPALGAVIINCDLLLAVVAVEMLFAYFVFVLCLRNKFWIVNEKVVSMIVTVCCLSKRGGQLDYEDNDKLHFRIFGQSEESCYTESVDLVFRAGRWERWLTAAC